MISPRIQGSSFTPINTSNVFTSTINEDAQNTSFSSYHVTPRQGATPRQLSRIQENNECEDSKITDTDPQTYREVIKELSTQLQMAILENRQLKDKINVLEEEHNESFQIVNTQNQMLQDSNFTLQEKINNLFSEIQQMQLQLEQKDQKLKEVRENNLFQNQSSDKLTHLMDENQKLIKIIETQQQEINIQKDVIKQFEKALQDAKGKVEQDVTEKLNHKCKEIDQFKHEIEGLHQQQQQYKEQIMLWSQRYQSLDQNYQIQYQDLFQKFNISQNQLAELQNIYQTYTDNSQRKIQQLVQELDNAKVGTLKKQQTLKQKALEDRIDELEEQLQIKKNQILKLKEELMEYQNIQKLTKQQRDTDIIADKRVIVEDQIQEKYEQRIRQLEDKLVQQEQQILITQQQQQQQSLLQQQQSQYQSLPQQQSIVLAQQSQQQQQQLYEHNYYARTNENKKLQLFSERKDNLRMYYSFAKENQQIENKYPRTALNYGNNY
ncbi:unnamed protein product [Paramecium pentaurelia]|uniref:Uncharacterized protein n=1 Tax=Paramecium pentaurelia TaxID=43138 RepID=A0A8S1S8T6_9CILI|nr:unnamed protein product [Paramecium pentaurelia]